MNIFTSFNVQLDDLLWRICQQLQLTKSQRESAEERYRGVAEWLADDSSILLTANPSIYPQGSLRIGTTVKPISRNEYDLDLICELGIDSRTYIPAKIMGVVEKRLQSKEIYRKLIKRPKQRCIRLEYANEFHLDIVPACPNYFLNSGAIKIPDRQLNTWLDSNPKAYAQWFEQRVRPYVKLVEAREIEPLPPEEDGESKPPLKYAVQLMKRNKDIFFRGKEDTIVPKSIVLTTLAGEFYDGGSNINDSLSNILGRIIQSIPPHSYERLKVTNPVAPTEDLTDFWDENRTAYEEFRKWIQVLNKTWQELQRKRGIPEIATDLQNLFGEPLVTQVIKEQTELINKHREEGRLGIAATSGVLKSLDRDTVPMKKNTFYGG